MTHAPVESFQVFGTTIVVGESKDIMVNRRTFCAAFCGVAGAAIARASVSAGQVTIVRFSDSGKKEGSVKVDKVVLSDEEWKKKLSPEEFEVARKAGTEQAFTGRYWNNHEKGIYRCVCCANALFSSDTKFESGTGWPSFWAPLDRKNVQQNTDRSLGMVRTEVKCTQCDAHLGHLFDDGPPPTGLRYCMNSVSMKFIKA
jgi:peptide-methionine (R)-S-oxide reductase